MNEREHSWKVGDTSQYDYLAESPLPIRQIKQAPAAPDYKFNEGQLLAELRDYVNATYGQHYSQNRFQATEFIIDSGHGTGFALGNVMKYAQRYGKKAGKNRKDLLKILHYALIMLYVHDVENPEVQGANQ